MLKRSLHGEVWKGSSSGVGSVVLGMARHSLDPVL